jgi:hypothetical protein
MDTLESLKSGALGGSRELRLSCGLDAFPPEILDLSETLEVLDLSGNRLSSLPDDFERLQRLRIVFFSQNRFEIFPEVLARCPRLEMVGFKSCRIRTVGEEALPPSIRWLILTDNRLEALPDSIGRRPRLQKLMLAGNRLRNLPRSLADCRNLELLRISANRLEAFPDWLTGLGRLSWLAWSGNPFCPPARSPAEGLPAIPFRDLSFEDVLGQGASGIISKAAWKRPDGIRHVAAKVFKGHVTSDGYPQDEMAACIAAGSHPNLVELEGRLEDHPEGLHGLVLGLIPPRYRNLGLPPSYESCTRDVFPAGAAMEPGRLRAIAEGVASLAAHLHRRGVNHGDLYAHNILVDDRDHPLMGDFGAASRLDILDPVGRERLQRLEVRAFGCLLDDLLGLVEPSTRWTESVLPLRELRDACMVEAVDERPLFEEIVRRF